MLRKLIKSLAGQKTRAVFPFLRQIYLACKAFKVGLCCVCASPVTVGSQLLAELPRIYCNVNNNN